ncbi:MAG: CoA pyrophosphatase [Myxococcales bacterium]|nr:MAG: CoA pyrophosphatase [Myxococcales bacterium]
MSDADRLLARIAERLAAYEARDMDDRFADFVPAAVMMPLLVKDGRLHILFTKRTQDVKHHKGQISFPGGSRDPEDASLLDCALRETEEEIGLSRDGVQVFGRLDATPVITRYVMTPFVGKIPYPYHFTPSAIEIDSLLFLPLDAFLDPAVHSLSVNEFMGQDVPIHFYKIGDETVWGATGRVLTQFFQVCLDYVPPVYGEFLASHPGYDVPQPPDADDV